MAFNQDWDENEPTKQTEARELDVVIRELKEALRERLQEQHNFYSDESGEDDVGEHKVGSARIYVGESGDRPDSDSDNPGSVYLETDTDEIYIDNGSEWVPLTWGGYEVQKNGDDDTGIINFKTE